MDPPPEQELTSLMTSHRNGDFFGDGLESPSTPSRSSPNFTNRRSTTTNNNNGITSPTKSTFSLQKKIAIVALLAIAVGSAVMMMSDVDIETEEEAVETVELVHHDDESSIAVDNNVVDDDKSTDATDDKSTATATTEQSSSSHGGSSSNSLLTGFHDASFENIYGANYYLKPKGVGYPIRPIGGIHPIYMIDHQNDNDDITLPPDDDWQNYEISPYTDKRLKMTPEERQVEQTEWEAKLQSIRDTYGYWNFMDDYPSKHNGNSRPTVDWSTVYNQKKYTDNPTKFYNPLHGEISKDDFPKDVWQSDNNYIRNFIKESRSLINRVREGIYAEYGWGPAEELTKEQLELRSDYLKITIAEEDAGAMKSIDASTNGVAWIYRNSFDALVKKLLNAMITNDHFFVTLGGHSSAAGHGNNFFQSYMMQFQNVMEPVFDRLGMVLVTANRAQGGMGTLQAVLAGGDVYGEHDFMVWDSSMTEKDGRLQDVFHRMMLLSGHRVPILFDIGGGKSSMDRIRNEVGAHVGGLTSGNPHLAETESLEQALTLPHALQHVFCKGGVATCGQREFKYNASCWTERVDVDPPPKEQNKGYGGQAKWHPGNRSHQLIARRMTLLFLHALDEAMNVWEKATESEGNPLDGKYWHLAEEEEKIRDKLKSANATATPCGEAMKLTPRVCVTQMRGGTEWTPRYRGDEGNIRRLLKPSSSGYVPEMIDIEEQVYLGRDPLQPQQRVPKGEVDVAMIARSLPPRKESRRSLSRIETSTSAAPNKVHIVGKNASNEGNKMLRKESKGGIIGRHLAEDSGSIVPGEGWEIGDGRAGFCDGTSNAVCARHKTSDCLMSGHNDGRGVLQGDALSGWLVFDLKDVTQGLFLARMQPWQPFNSIKRTEGWTTENNAARDRYLKAPPPPKPADWRVEVAVNGVVIKSLNETEYNDICIQPGYNLVICTLWDDEERARKNEKEDVEFAFRMAGGGREGVMGITHVYYA
jgi:hypothetical protein